MWLINHLKLDRETSTGEYSFGRREVEMMIEDILEVSCIDAATPT